ncbi:MAG: hypothetical protein M9962_01700 [Oligoflexia bacterium]|nr:hypothetical protein [Oligoflexia bacterium]
MKIILVVLFYFIVLPCFAMDISDDDLDQVIEDTITTKSSANGKPTIIYRKKTTVSFDDAVVEGSGNNPEGVYVVSPPDKQFGSLLKLRPNFHKELIRDSLLIE